MPPDRVSRASPLVIAAAACAMAAWTWGTWPDLWIDFGAQLYLPWRMSEGAVPFRDFPYIFGPLSQFFHAALFSAFGVGLRTLVAANLALLALLIALLHHIFREVGDRRSATAACLAFVTLFAFAQFVGIGNYNYVCPYAYEVTHGLILSLAAIAGLGWARVRGPWALACPGLLLGLAFLTKPEIFLAGAVAVLAGFSMTLWERRPGWRRGSAMAGILAASALVPPLAALAILSRIMPARVALAGLRSPWAATARAGVTRMKFYRLGLGTYDVAESVRLLLGWAGLYAAVLVPALVVGLALRRPGRARAWAPAVAFVAVAAVLWAGRREIAFLHAARPFPVFVMMAMAASLARFLRARRDGEDCGRAIRQVTILVFAMALLAKMILNARLFHYGFALAMPATLALIVAVMDWVPGAIDRLGGAGAVFRGAGLALLLAIAAAHLDVQAALIRRKDQVVGRGADAFRADDSAAEFHAVLRGIDRHSPPGRTLAVFPSGAMLNYLTRRPNPTPFLNVGPLDVLLFGEETIFSAYRDHPPDMIYLKHFNMGDFEDQYFMMDYARPFGPWVRENYRPVSLLGGSASLGKASGLLMKRVIRPPTSRPGRGG